MKERKNSGGRLRSPLSSDGTLDRERGRSGQRFERGGNRSQYAGPPLEALGDDPGRSMSRCQRISRRVQDQIGSSGGKKTQRGPDTAQGPFAFAFQDGIVIFERFEGPGGGELGVGPRNVEEVTIGGPSASSDTHFLTDRSCRGRPCGVQGSFVQDSGGGTPIRRVTSVDARDVRRKDPPELSRTILPNGYMSAVGQKLQTSAAVGFSWVLQMPRGPDVVKKRGTCCRSAKQLRRGGTWLVPSSDGQTGGGFGSDWFFCWCFP